MFDAAKPEWTHCRSFVTQRNCPELARITCAFDAAAGIVTFSHPQLGEIAVRPEADEEALSAWLAPIAAASADKGPYRVARVPGGALMDFPDSDISIGSLASLRVLEEIAGKQLEHIRFRMNLWVDDLDPWVETDWSEIKMGAARLRILRRVKRCRTPDASPKTGARDIELLKLLHGRFGHMDFGVYAQVIESGAIAIGDACVAEPAS